MGVFKDEPVACIGLLVTLLLGIMSSPILLDWYTGPKLNAVVDYTYADDDRCIPWKLLVSNNGNATATNVRVQYSTDFFTNRGDIQAYYSGNQPLFGIKKMVEYTQGKNYVLIPNLLPGLNQEFIFVEEFPKADIEDKRLKLLSKKDPSVLNFPKIDFVTSNEGQVSLSVGNNECE